VEQSQHCVPRLRGAGSGVAGGRGSSADACGAAAEIVTNSRDDSLQVLDIRKNSSLRYLAHASYKNGVNWNRAAVSPDGQFVVAGGQDGSLVFWNRETGEHASTIKNAHKSAVVSCSWVCAYLQLVLTPMLPPSVPRASSSLPFAFPVPPMSRSVRGGSCPCGAGRGAAEGGAATG
jgi:hypothetical protein